MCFLFESGEKFIGDVYSELLAPSFCLRDLIKRTSGQTDNTAPPPGGGCSPNERTSFSSDAF